jgi:hypothetical protein
LERYPYNSSNIDSLIDKLSDVRVDGSYYLLVLAGKYTKGKNAFLSKLSKKAGEISSVDLRSVISTNEEDAYRNLDRLFTSMDDTQKVVHLEHGDVLSGEYTGFTYSSVRYATPQEKYLLNKIQQSEKVVILDLIDKANITKSLERKAQAAIDFDEPASGLGKLFWKLKQIRLNGHTFENKRPLDVR